MTNCWQGCCRVYHLDQSVTPRTEREEIREKKKLFNEQSVHPSWKESSWRRRHLSNWISSHQKLICVQLCADAVRALTKELRHTSTVLSLCNYLLIMQPFLSDVENPKLRIKDWSAMPIGLWERRSRRKKGTWWWSTWVVTGRQEIKMATKRRFKLTSTSHRSIIIEHVSCVRLV